MVFVKWLGFLLLVCSANAAQVYYIKADNSSSTCPKPCLTLNDFAALDTKANESVSVLLLPGEHFLTSYLLMANKTDSNLRAESTPVTIRCNGMGAVILLNVTNMLVEHISFVTCNVMPGNVGSVSIFNSTDVSLISISASEVRDSTVASITNSSVLLNSMKLFYNRNGIVIVISAHKNSHVTFSGDCVFENNYGIGLTASKSTLIFNGNVTFRENDGDPQSGFSGMKLESCEMYIHGKLKFVNNSGPSIVDVESSILTSNGSLEFDSNAGGNGLPLFHVSNSQIDVRSLIFTMNRGFSLFVLSPLTVLELLDVSNNTLLCNEYHSVFDLLGSTTNVTGNINVLNNQGIGDCTAGIEFVKQEVYVNGILNAINNHADFSSGILFGKSVVTVYGIVIIANNSASGEIAGLSVEFSNLYIRGSFKVSGNRGLHQATCVAFLNSNFFVNGSVNMVNSRSELYPYFVSGSNVSFVGTTCVSSNIGNSKYGGGLYIASASIVRLEESYVFADNQALRSNGGALYTFDSELIFSGNGTFTNNVARYGGALYLVGGSKLTLSSQSTTIFSQNKAIAGGAIFVESHLSFVNCTDDPRYISEPAPCFFGIESVDSVLLKFDNNKAPNGGTSLYGGLLNQCTLSENTNALEVFKQISNFTSYNMLSISSDPFHLCFCQDGFPNCNLPERNVTTKRGAHFVANVSIQNEFEASIAGLVRSYLISNFSDTDKILGGSGILQKVNNTCTELKFRVSSPLDVEHLTVYAEGSCGDVGNTSKVLNVHFLDCPIGFVLDHGSCVCDQYLLSYTTSCNIDNESIERSSNFWVGVSHNESGNFTGLELYPNCPFDYCLLKSSVILSYPDMQCNHNRSGTLCGSCLVNTSLLLGSSACDECTNIYLLLLIPFTLLGILLVACLFLLKLTVETGALHGLLFYANIVALNKAIMVPSGTFKGLSIFLAWLNLDFGIETCFFKGMSQYSKTWLQFVFPSYLLALVLLIIVICKCSFSGSKFFAIFGDPVCVLVTVILLSYTKIVRTILEALSFASINFSDGSSSALVWLFDGNVKFAQGSHVILVIFASTLLLLFVLPYTTILTGIQFVTESCWVSNTLIFKNAYQIFKRYHPPYKSRHRYWPGMFLIIRIVYF